MTPKQRMAQHKSSLGTHKTGSLSVKLWSPETQAEGRNLSVGLRSSIKDYFVMDTTEIDEDNSID